MYAVVNATQSSKIHQTEYVVLIAYLPAPTSNTPETSEKFLDYAKFELGI